VDNLGPTISSNGLEGQGLAGVAKAHWNYGTAALYTAALSRGEGRLANGGSLVVETGVHTGRSAQDKFIVREPSSENDISWGAINKPFDADQFDALLERVQQHMSGREVFVQDCWAGAARDYRLGVRVVTEKAWHNLFARNMFLQPTADELAGFDPEFTVIQAPSFRADADRDGTRSDCFIIANFAKKIVLIGGTYYAGEIKKSVFSILNYLLPARGVMPMHCSINVGEAGDSAIFFGLSGTGKTTLSADPRRELIGDDEHGWSDAGVFNFEGGCYAKVIDLSEKAEPEIHATTRMFGTVLENVVMDPMTGGLDLFDGALTQNTRASYPIDFIPNASPTGVAGHPKNVVMLTADAFGVLPPISKLTPEQAMYHFLSGYTAKVAGTEKGLGNEPQATFSTCFGAPFMPRHPSVYANLLGEKIAKHGANCWLVNTGWTGGVFGVGRRMPIDYTRALLNAALDGSLDGVPTRTDPNFGVQVPTACPGVPEDVLNPRGTWDDGGAYDAKAGELVGRFNDNFEQFESYVENDIRAAAPNRAA
jgi:phosphoenolpyruvate carboxykinase (ATP)